MMSKEFLIEIEDEDTRKEIAEQKNKQEDKNKQNTKKRKKEYLVEKQ